MFPRAHSTNVASSLDAAIETYGGWDVWRRLESVTLRIDRLDGLLVKWKGLGRTFPAPHTATVKPAQWRVEFGDFPTAGERAIFDRGRIQIIDRADQCVLDRPQYRTTFHGLRKHRRWSPADAAYFFGSALATYLSVPFILPDYARRVSSWSQGLVVSAHFPDSIDTHCPRQRFWFDRRGYLVRHDYRADIVGWWAVGAHFTSNYETVNGLPIATRRRVVARVFGLATGLPVLSADVRPI